MKKFMRFLGADPDEGTSGDFTGFVALIRQILLSLNLGWGAYLACAGPDPAGRRAFPVRDLRDGVWSLARLAELKFQQLYLPIPSTIHCTINHAERKKAFRLMKCFPIMQHLRYTSCLALIDNY